MDRSLLGRLFGAAAPRARLWRLLSRPGLALRGLGIVYVVAFTSLRKQVLGLYGARGILPIQSHLRDIDRAVSAVADDQGVRHRWSWWQRFRLVPSLLWLDASDAGLKRLCTAGQIAGAALAFGIGGRLAAATAWGAYLSFVSVGRDFLRFQWDVLLLEAGLQAALGRPRRLLSRLLAFRLQLESGIAKLASRDPHLARSERVLSPSGDAAVAHAARLVCAPPAATVTEGRDGDDSRRRVRGAVAGVRSPAAAPACVRDPDGVPGTDCAHR